MTNTKIDNCLFRDCADDKPSTRRLTAVEELTGGKRRLQAASEQASDRDILAGFFYISSNSKMDVGGSIVKRTTGSLGGAAMIMTGSAVSIGEGSTFKQIQVTDVTSSSAGVIEAQNAKSIDISDSMFGYNEGADILCANTKPLSINGTNFYGNAIEGAPPLEKNSPFIKARNSELVIADGTNFQFSVGEGTRGIDADGSKMTLTNNVRFDSLKNDDE